MATEDDGAMHQRTAGFGQIVQLPFDLLGVGIGAAKIEPVGQQGAWTKKAEFVQELKRGFAKALEHGFHLQHRLAAMQPDRTIQLRTGLGGPLQQFHRAALDPIGGQHGSDQPVVSAIELSGKIDGCVQALQATGFIPMHIEAAIRMDHRQAGPVCRSQIGTQSQLRCDLGATGKLVVGFAPFAIQQRGNRQGRGNAIVQ